MLTWFTAATTHIVKVPSMLIHTTTSKTKEYHKEKNKLIIKQKLHQDILFLKDYYNLSTNQSLRCSKILLSSLGNKLEKHL